MKKLYIILTILVLLLTSCSIGESNMNFYFGDNISIADKTFEKVVTAIETNDAKLLESYFSANVQAQVPELHTQATDFLNFIDGEVVSYTSSRETGVGASMRNQHGQKCKELLATFTLKTNSQTYHIEIKEVIIDHFDRKNMGIQSMYIINANDWELDYVFGSGGECNPGINMIK